jgi:pimeloyl-ACP methyl ester carboxylesterase
MLGLGLLSYGGLCLFLFIQQRDLILNPRTEIIDLPSNAPYHLPYETRWLPVSGTYSRLHSWWIPAKKQPTLLSQPRTLLYFGGRGGNISFHLARMEGLRQLGFAILMVDYRGFGGTGGETPNETQMYADAQAAWEYLTQTAKIPPEQIVIYGESLGGAVALDLAVKQPQAGGVILQSTFTSMADMAARIDWLKWFPINLMLTERFDSRAKIPQLRVPILLVHGEADAIVPASMSRQLFDLAPAPKRLLIIPNKGHITIYQKGPYSYLQAIREFVGNL